jgi:hypothetical protein
MAAPEGTRHPVTPTDPGAGHGRPHFLVNNRVATQRMIANGYQTRGTVDQVKRQLEKLVKCHVQDRQLELFATKIMPEFRQCPSPM